MLRSEPDLPAPPPSYSEAPPAYTNSALEVDSTVPEVVIGDNRSATSEENGRMAAAAFGGHMMVVPPSYQAAAELPTYDEAEATKEGKPLPPRAEVHGNGGVPPTSTGLQLPGFITISTSSELSPDSSPTSCSEYDPKDEALLGNDFIFFTAFVSSFLFNWVGFLLMMCFCHTIAARYGALSGFGLSLTKWTLIVKRSADFRALAHRNSHGGEDSAAASNTGLGHLGGGGNVEADWLWWLVMAFGLLICIRALLQYLAIKRTWRGLSPAAKERLFFFY